MTFVLETSQQLFGVNLDEARPAQIQSAVKDGGQGLRHRSGPHVAAAWIASWGQCRKEVRNSTGWELSMPFFGAQNSRLATMLRGSIEDLQASGVRGAARLLDTRA